MDYKNIDLELRKSIVITLIVFAFTIFISFIIIEKYILENEFKKQVLSSSSVNIEKKELELKNLIKDTKNSLFHLSTISNFKKALATNNFQELNKLFLTVSQTNSYFMQLRYLDKNGQEKIRIDRDIDTSTSYIVPENQLQNKSKRDYFIDSKSKKDFYISKLNLNIENDKVEYPFRPTLRIILPINKKEKFLGELVVNIEIDLFFESSLFNTMICDTNGRVIIPFDKTKENFDKNLDDYFSDTSNILSKKKYINKNYISYRLETDIKNDIIIVSELKGEYFKRFQEDQYKLRILIFSFLLIFIIIVIYFVSKKINEIFYLHFKSKLDDKIKHSNKEFKAANEFLSNNVDPELILSQASTSMILTDKNKNILYVNKAFTKLFGYEEKEILNKDPGFLRNEDLDQRGIKALNEALKNNESVTVVVRNYTKDNQLKYIELSISPIFHQETDKIIYYLGIYKDVTREQNILRDLKRIF